MILPFWTLANEVPEVIHPKTLIIQNQSWYATQSLLWKDRAIQDNLPSDWLNYYLASRYANSDPEGLSFIEREMSGKHPEAPETFFVRSWHMGFVVDSYWLALKANEVAPGKDLFLPWLVMQHEFNGRLDERNKTSESIYSGGSISVSLLHYSYNVLMSLDKNAVLVTDSDNTTVPLFILQDVLHLRPDVAIVNLDMMLDPGYRERKLVDNGLTMPVQSGPVTKPELCAALPMANTGRAFYYALTLARENTASIKDQLYVVGLASQISAERIDNINIIRQNLENKFMLDYLSVDFNGESNIAAGKVLSANYLVPMLLLDDHYRSVGQNEKAEQLEVLIHNLADQNGKSSLVNNFLNRSAVAAKPFIPFKLDLKSLEGSFKLVKDKIYANVYEVTNKEYNAYLAYLQQHKLSEMYELCRIQLDKYEEPALSYMRGYHTVALPNKKNKYFSDYPVVNISYEAATEYCAWLTEQYNKTLDRKYKRVSFRLPSMKEWQLAATGVKNASSWNLSEIKGEIRKFEEGREIGKKFESVIVTLDDPQVLYPWWGVYALRNSPLNVRGCSLGNFKFPPDVKPCNPEKMATPDGFFMASSVGAYFPNGIGLYDVVGNIAEMSDVKGSAFGGSWNHAPEESTMKSINKYEAPNADIGFRIFMEVLEQ
jgi:hypothetical protein